MNAKHQMTAEEATTFEHHSMTNAAILESVCPQCAAYQDWFTYNRWAAQGMQVQRGEHGTKIAVIVEEEDGAGKTERRFWKSTVFCRHQVATK